MIEPLLAGTGGPGEFCAALSTIFGDAFAVYDDAVKKTRDSDKSKKNRKKKGDCCEGNVNPGHIMAVNDRMVGNQKECQSDAE